MSDEQYAPGLTDAELRERFDPVTVQSFRENPYWRQPGNVVLLYALDRIEALERQYQTLLRQLADQPKGDR